VPDDLDPNAIVERPAICSSAQWRQGHLCFSLGHARSQRRDLSDQSSNRFHLLNALLEARRNR